jgi:hypothetical protein
VLVNANFIQGKAAQLVVENPASKSLGTLAKQIRRGTAKDEKTGRVPASVDKHPKDRKEIREPLNFVYHNKALAAFKGQHRVAQTGQIFGVFQVLIRDRTT